jgi:hypothetical protein
MLRRVATQALARLSAARSISTSARALADEPGAVPAGLDVFKEKWASVAPSTLSVPEFPSNFLEPEESATEPGAEDKFTVKVFTPTGTAAEGKVSPNRRGESGRGGRRRRRSPPPPPSSIEWGRGAKWAPSVLPSFSRRSPGCWMGLADR